MAEGNGAAGPQVINGTRNPRALTPYDRNARTHSDEQIGLLCDSITQYGFTRPVIIDEADMILAGHGATTAALRLELPEVPVRQMLGLTDEQKRAYVLIDNRTAELSEWDKELLSFEVGELAEANFELALLGWDEAELEVMTGDIPEGTFPELTETESPAHQQMTFILHTSQVESVKAAIRKAREAGKAQSDLNKNGNGNALAFIAEQYVAD